MSQVSPNDQSACLRPTCLPPSDRVPTLGETASKLDSLTSVVERIKSESIRINQALLDPDTTDDRYRELYAAQQALGWALDPTVARSPYETIMADKCGRVTTVAP